MKSRIIQVATAFVFIWALLWLGSCTHQPGIYYDNTPKVSNNCSADSVYFQNDIQPLLNSTCALSGCHDAVIGKEGLVLTDYAAVMKTGGINLQNPAESKIYRVLGKGGDDVMPPPPASPWSSTQQAALLTWISQGALNNACTDTICDTTQVTFAASVAPIFQKYCYGCHNSSNTSGGVDLTNFSQLSLLVSNGSLLGSIRHDAGFIPMPVGGNKLSDCEIRTIAIWALDTILPVAGNRPVVSTCDINRSKLYTILSASGGDDKSASAGQGVQDGIMPPPSRTAFNTVQKNLLKNWINDGIPNN